MYVLKWLETARARVIAMLAAVAVLAGCQEVLYSNLSENDANEMVALLVLSGVPASREVGKDQSYSVAVDKDDIAIAVTVLKNAGLPRETFASLGEVFGDAGVVSTKFEERIRFAFATNEELSRTITAIKGVDSARVHVVIPPEGRFGASNDPARASIAIFHDRNFEPAQYSSRIKALVAYAVPKLEVENISTNFFPSVGFVVEPVTEPNAPGSVIAASATGLQEARPASWQLPFVELAGLFLLMFAIRSVVIWSRRPRRRWPKAEQRS
ncbi:MAG: type III secretion inner membrane ring lipoprotein SctJ [Pseudomonadota bacterium]